MIITWGVFLIGNMSNGIQAEELFMKDGNRIRSFYTDYFWTTPRESYGKVRVFKPSERIDDKEIIKAWEKWYDDFKKKGIYVIPERDIYVIPERDIWVDPLFLNRLSFLIRQFAEENDINKFFKELRKLMKYRQEVKDGWWDRIVYLIEPPTSFIEPLPEPSMNDELGFQDIVGNDLGIPAQIYNDLVERGIIDSVIADLADRLGIDPNDIKISSIRWTILGSGDGLQLQLLPLK